MIGLIDGDLIVYACAFSVEKKRKIEVPGEGITEHKREVGPLSHAIQNTDTLMKSIAGKFMDIETYLTGTGNWRYEFAKIQPYKGNRSPFSKPVYYNEIRQHLVDKYKAIVINGMEADDALGIQQTSRKDTCIVSTDKDLKMIPGAHYNWKKDESKHISESDGIRNFYSQVLSGDGTDFIQGIYGIGKAKSQRYFEKLSDERSMWQVANKCWHDHYPDGYDPGDGRKRSVRDSIVEVATLLWIARSGRERWNPPERNEKSSADSGSKERQIS